MASFAPGGLRLGFDRSVTPKKMSALFHVSIRLFLPTVALRGSKVLLSLVRLIVFPMVLLSLPVHLGKPQTVVSTRVKTSILDLCPINPGH